MAKDLTDAQFINKLIEIFGENTNCSVQHKGCPCNSYFHNQKGDFTHICWLIVLALRGDYNDQRKNILDRIRDEL